MPEAGDGGDVERALARIRERAASLRAVDREPVAIGPYRVVRCLGRGGMGAVYLATAPAPLDRQVAIKLVRPGLGGEAVLARFRREQRAIARLEHEHIARVFDAGTAADGRPFLVMEYVDGPPIDAFCRARQLPLRRRLELFLQVAAAVEHAHLRGFVHRDLKPANVLVCERDRAPAVKVIDFGLAAVDDDALAGDGPRTLPGQVLGTPGYMSPEQAAGGDVDARTDAYSLGVLLHELVTGARPDRTPSAALRPSVTVAALPAAAAAALQRELALEPRTLLRQLRPDLDWIVEQATALLPKDRYQGVHALAADVRCVLDRRPLPNRPSGLWYRLQKRAAQNRLAATLALAALLLLVLGATGTVAGLVEARANLELFQHLASVEMMRRAHVDEAELYPPVPARIPAMQDWLERYRGQTEARIERLGEAVAALQRRALDEPEAVRQRDREASPYWVRLQKLRRHLADAEARNAGVDAATPLVPLENLERQRVEIAGLERKVEAVRVYRFASSEDAYQYGALLPTLEAMRDFAVTTIARVERALRWAEDLAARDGAAARTRWTGALARIAAQPAYRGVALPVQRDLMPLGPDLHSGLEEFAHLRSGRVPTRDPASGTLQIDGDTGLVFVLLPGGEVGWGAQAKDPQAPWFDPDAAGGEGNARTGRLEPFFASKYEMTRGQWGRLYGSDPSHWQTGQSYAPQRDRPMTLAHPVESMDWSEAGEQLRHEGLDLPTEVQWEYAARAGSDAPWYTGTDPSALQGHANLVDRDGWDDGWSLLAPVGSFAPNAFGLHDVHGNVREWCRDRYANYEGCTGMGDLMQTDVDAGKHRVVRGGSYAGDAKAARVGARDATPPALEGFTLGVRPIRRIDRGPGDPGGSGG